jgi:hypothetical protein
MDTEYYPVGTNLLEDVFADTSDQNILRVLHNVDFIDFELSLYGSSKKLQRRFCSYLSIGFISQMINNCLSGNLPETDVIIKSQNILLDTYRLLR